MTSSIFRSEEMKYVHLLMTQDSAYDIMSELGAFGKLHLIDLSAAHENAQPSELHLYYKKRVNACLYWEKKLESFRKAMEDNKVEPPGIDIRAVDERFPDVLEALKNYLEPLEETLNQNLQFRRQQTQRINELIERSKVLEKCRDAQLFRRPAEMKGEYKEYKGEDSKLGDSKGEESKFSTTISGVIPLDRQTFFERMLFRISRGNAIIRTFPIDEKILDPQTGEGTQKVVFSVVFIGEQLKNRIVKICNFVGATIYTIPSEAHLIEIEIQDIRAREGEYSTVLSKTKDDINSLLQSVSYDAERKTSPLVNWEWALQKEKAICDAMRKCDLSQPRSNMISAEGWIPAENEEELRDHIDTAGHRTQSHQAVLHFYDNPGPPPTYFKLNKYTDVFQGIVNTYGVPRYQEANPGLFTIVTFPFLFGVMYGDIGHGFLLTLFSLYLIYKEKDLERAIKMKTLSEIPAMAFGGRYLLVLMGIFAIYCGSIYNDCFSIPFSFYKSEWIVDEHLAKGNFTNSVYPWGVDPGWYHTKNELLFFNSLKMKLSVTLGVTQMTFGILLSLTNHVYFNDSLSIAFEFLPQLLFMLSTFGYMIFLIICKMCIDFSKPGMIEPPNLIQTMISMFLSPGSVESKKQLYTGQGPVQGVLVLVAFLCIPVMLLVKPCVYRYRHKAAQRRMPQHAEDGAIVGGHQELKDDEHHDVKIDVGSAKAPSKKATGGHGGGHGGHGMGGDYNFGDHLITQSIHTIEFVLGAVSNTASYLRLWALSLAHAELANVFWEKMIMQYGVDKGVMVFVGFAIWAAATFAVLLCMDVLECFLHALRLHWVEFQSKFFHADGYAFKPFTFEYVEA